MAKTPKYDLSFDFGANAVKPKKASTGKRRKAKGTRKRSRGTGGS